MSVEYFVKANEVLDKIASTQEENIKKAAEIMSESITKGGLVHLFGSGHSVIPILDVFPRYGGIVGFHPLMDSRLMWFNVIGTGGARELLWIERQEGYIKNFLQSYTFKKDDTMVVYSHGGLNAAPVEAAMYAKEIGMKVIVVASGENYKKAKATHSTGKKLGDFADVFIDNCVPLEDALVPVEGYHQKVGAGSTLSVIYISQAFASETAKLLQKKGFELAIFVSPNVVEVPQENNDNVYAKYTEVIKKNNVVI
ncbi:sugar isomerase domain-containing protein [Geosporobacter ferrireducens]|uniref:SIS domain-containing protein n=1 Tax=Geosporobacter ferrireducens TaxID=1424294 RepID=A0A1D8GHD5_9FIRM|nr:SIS domain-containing protein [Geosporobacter ferrireducens]AOT70323.1 SIS domain-containing protein [Geosporobacter ferrireducens]MTI54291.1 SIS domain-containing protein [Geosporobacter ferrireducens]